MFIDQNVYNQCWETGALRAVGSSKVCLGQYLGYTKNEITKDQRQEWLGGSGGLPRNAALECTQKDKCFPRNRGKTFSDKGCCHMNSCRAIPLAKLLGAVSFQNRKRRLWNSEGAHALTPHHSGCLTEYSHGSVSVRRERTWMTGASLADMYQYCQLAP